MIQTFEMISKNVCDLTAQLGSLRLHVLLLGAAEEKAQDALLHVQVLVDRRR